MLIKSQPEFPGKALVRGDNGMTGSQFSQSVGNFYKGL
jgi:hypothetical protein